MQYIGHQGSRRPYYITAYKNKHERSEQDQMWQHIFSCSKSLGTNGKAFLLKSAKSHQVGANEAADRLLGQKLHSKSRQMRFANLEPTADAKRVWSQLLKSTICLRPIQTLKTSSCHTEYWICKLPYREIKWKMSDCTAAWIVWAQESENQQRRTTAERSCNVLQTSDNKAIHHNPQSFGHGRCHGLIMWRVLGFSLH